MRAIIETGGKQFAVAADKKIRVPTLVGEPGDTITIDRVLYVSDHSGDGAIHIGAPSVGGASVTAEIVRHGRGKKIRVFKYKRRKRYRKMQGHRQNFTEILITGVAVDAEKATKTATTKSAAKPAAEKAASADVFTCGDCGKKYKTARGLSQHQATAHGDGEE